MTNKEGRYIDPAKDDLLDGLEVRPVVKNLLIIAEKVAIGGLYVKPDDVRIAKESGATDGMIHDTVLIAAAFCMFTRYVDGLGCVSPAPKDFVDMGQRLAKEGY